MPTHPTPAGFKTCTFQFRIDLVDHLDRMAEVNGHRSRAGYVRQLILEDIRRQGAQRIPLHAAQQA
jgi:hypothetical protein